MAKGQSAAQKETVARVMHEFKHGELRTAADGAKVKDPKQAIAIALNEAGASNQEDAGANKDRLKRTKRKKREDETSEAAREGKRAQDATMQRATAHGGSSDPAPTRKSDLYAEAKRRAIPGRSKMSKAQLAHALEA